MIATLVIFAIFGTVALFVDNRLARAWRRIDTDLELDELANPQPQEDRQ